MLYELVEGGNISTKVAAKTAKISEDEFKEKMIIYFNKQKK